MSRIKCATLVAITAGVLNILPWGGPTMRAATALEVPVNDLFNPLVVPMISGLIAALIIAYLTGKSEKRGLPLNWEIHRVLTYPRN